MKGIRLSLVMNLGTMMAEDIPPLLKELWSGVCCHMELCHF
ncbi:hypothetical protein BDFB_003762, partial [Asbolus verrucosus]